MDRHIKEVLGQYLSKSRISNGYQSERLAKIWADKMGPSITTQTKYLRLNGHTLNIKITSSVLKHELFQNSEKIQNLLNDELGKDLIKEVKFL